MDASSSIIYGYQPSHLGTALKLASATLTGQGVTHLEGNWTTNAETIATDTIDLNTDLGKVQANTPSAQLTAGLAEILQSATHVDPATGAREITEGTSDKLAGQVATLLTGSGFSAADAETASQSVVQQLAGSSPSIGSLALSLVGKVQDSGGYRASVAGGQETSAWSAVSTTALNISFDQGTGDLAVRVDKQQVDATSISWASGAASDVSIALTKFEMKPIRLSMADPSTDRNSVADAGPPLHETLATTTSGTDTTAGGNETAGTSYDGTKSLPGSTAVSFENDSGLQTALQALRAIRELNQNARSSDQQGNEFIRLKLGTKIGNAGFDQNEIRFLTYIRPNEKPGLINLPSVDLQL